MYFSTDLTGQIGDSGDSGITPAVVSLSLPMWYLLIQLYILQRISVLSLVPAIPGKLILTLYACSPLISYKSTI